jgi:hypothetical protein
MDSRIIDLLSRRMAGATTRRDTVRIIAATLAATATASVAGPSAVDAAEVDQAGVPILSCKVPGQLCQGDKACCSGRCKQGICTCQTKGRRCWKPAEGAFCCSGRCSGGRCR